MKSMRCLSTGVSVLAFAAVASFSASASADQKILYPSKLGAARLDLNRPLSHIGSYDGAYVAPKKNKSGKWTDVKGTLPFQGGPVGSMLMTDGTVLTLDFCT